VARIGWDRELAVLVDVVVQEVLAEGPGVLDGYEALGEVGEVLEALEVRLSVGLWSDRLQRPTHTWLAGANQRVH